MTLAAIIEWDALLDVVGASLLAVVGLTAACSLAIVGATGMIETRRDGRSVASVGYAVLAGLALAACAAGVALGIVVMTAK